MSNHVHFVLMCSQEEAVLFINKFKRLYAAYYRKKYGVSELLRRNGVDIREVFAGDESLEKAVAYVIMNCVAANICLEPSGYRWGSGNLCFNGTLVSGTRLSFPRMRTFAIRYSGSTSPRSCQKIRWRRCSIN